MLEMNSMQLLHYQAPISSFMLLYIIPFVDSLPDINHVSAGRWFMVLLVRNESRSYVEKHIC
jgi:solute carrier family 35 protein E3